VSEQRSKDKPRSGPQRFYICHDHTTHNRNTNTPSFNKSAMSADSSKLHSIFASTRKALLKHTSRRRDPALAARTPIALNGTKRPLSTESYNQDLAQVTRTEGLALRVNVPSEISDEGDSARAVREYFFCSICKLTLLFKAHLNNLDLVHLDDHDLNLATPGQILSLATNTRSAQYARKHLTMHKIRVWESHLDAARARVVECEGMIRDLRREVDEIAAIIGGIEGGLDELQDAMLPAGSIDTSADSIKPGSIDPPFRNSDIESIL
jgi:hypothetical protein